MYEVLRTEYLIRHWVRGSHLQLGIVSSNLPRSYVHMVFIEHYWSALCIQDHTRLLLPRHDQARPLAEIVSTYSLSPVVQS